MNRHRKPHHDPFLLTAAVVTILVITSPFLLYILGRLQGTITTPEEWFTSQGHNHGPWREETYGLLVYAPFLLLIPITALAGVWWALRQGRRTVVPGTGVIIALQVAGLLLHLKYLFWLVD